MTQRSVLVLAGLCVSSLALALTPSRSARVEHVPAGTAWIAGHGTRGLSSHAPAVRHKVGFDAGATWWVRDAAPLGLARHYWGRGVLVDARAMDDASVAERVAREFWQVNADLLPAGVSPRDLALWSNVTTDDTRLVSHQQLLGGVPVLGASVFVALKAGRLVMVGMRALPTTALDVRPRLDAAQARALAERALHERGVQVPAIASELAVLPLLERGRVGHALVHRVELRAPGRGRWTAYVDAHKGELVALRDERLFASGQLEVQQHQRHPGSPMVFGPARDLAITSGGSALYTDAAGGFVVGGSDLSAELGGRHIRVRNQAGQNLSARFTDLGDGQTLQWTSDQSEQQVAQLDAYQFASEASAYARRFAGDLPWLSELLPVNVNYDDVCNAWFDGELTFLQAGEAEGFRCNNSAMVGDIVYHEFGHGLHYGSVVGGIGGMDEAVSEGFADFLSASLTGDHALAPYFSVAGEPLRDLEPDLVWPADEGFDPHDTGLIVGGALWDLRTQLMQRLGDVAGAEQAARLYFAAMRTTSDVPSLYEAVMLADDDNGDLDDGTPNLCAIDLAFAPHGLSSQHAGLLRIVHAQRSQVAADQPIPFEVQVSAGNTGCDEVAVGSVRLVYRTDSDSAQQSADLHPVGGDSYRVELPAMSQGTQLRYRIEARDEASGTTLVRPTNSAEPWYFVYVGALEPVFCDDFEGEDQGWSHDLLSGSQVEGADDWQRATPSGLGGDPDHAYSGEHAWGTDLALEDNWNGQYQSSKKTTLISPAVDLSAVPRARLQFMRWLQVEDGTYDRARVLVNDQVVWSNLAGDGQTHHLDSEWILFDVDISALAGGQPEVRVRFELESDQGLEFGGWNIDDVCIVEMVEGRVEPTVDPTTPTDPAVERAPGEGGAHEVLGGCGCQGTAAGGSLLPLVALLGVLGLRRRRR